MIYNLETVKKLFYHLNEIRVKDLPLLPDVEAALNLWSNLLLLWMRLFVSISNKQILTSFNSMTRSVSSAFHCTLRLLMYYLEVGHRLLDSAPELVQELAIVALR